MPVIYEPKTIHEKPESQSVEPHIELLPDRLRLHFHEGGVSFGLIDPFNPAQSVLITYEKARAMMLGEAKAARHPA